MNNFKKSENPLLLLQVLNVLNNLCEIKELTDSLSIYLYLNYLNELTVNKECRGNNNCKVLDDSNSVNYAFGWNWNASTSEDTILAEYEWNEENRLTKASVNNTTVNYLYNAGGERTYKEVEDKSKTAYVDKLYQVQIGDHKDCITKHIFVGASRLVSKVTYEDLDNSSTFEQNNYYWYHSDHLGSSNFISDTDGSEFEHIEYMPYGETWFEDGGNSVNNYITYKFTGKELDSTTGLYYFGARYYDPKTSLWISPDPIYDGIKEGLGVYTYCKNNPVIFVDPTGLESEDKSTPYLDKKHQEYLNKMYEVYESQEFQDWYADILEYKKKHKHNRYINYITSANNIKKAHTFLYEKYMDGLRATGAIGAITPTNDELWITFSVLKFGPKLVDGAGLLHDFLLKQYIKLQSWLTVGGGSALIKLFEQIFKRSTKIENIKPNPTDPFNYPYNYNADALRGYRDYILKNGSLSSNDPINVIKLSDGTYQILNGHHRWYAAIQTGLKTVPIKIVEFFGGEK